LMINITIKIIFHGTFFSKKVIIEIITKVLSQIVNDLQ
jgi:hypothetical protein